MRNGFLGHAAVVMLVGLFVILVDLADGRSLILDVDDQLRALQIRLLTTGPSTWFDLALPAISMPEVYVSPWSRLVDLPYALIAWTLAPFLGAPEALGLAFAIWPPIMLAGYALLVAVFLQRPMIELGWPPLRQALLVCLVALMMGPALLEFTPGRIDHHNVQLLAMLGLLVGLQRFDRTGAIVVGFCSAVSLVVGLECLPLIMAAYGGLVVFWLIGDKRADVMMGSAGASFALCSIALGLLFVGPAGMVAGACDAFSAPFALAALGLGLLLALLASWGRGKRSSIRFGMLTLSAAAVILSIVALYPDCLAGPYGMIDPIVRSNWLDRIPQEHGLLFQIRNGSLNVLAITALPILLAIWAMPALLARAVDKPGLVLAFVVALASLVAMIVQLRYARFPIALLPLFAPLIVGWVLCMPSRVAVLGASVASAVVLLAVGGGGFLSAGSARAIGLVETMASRCEGADFSAVTGLGEARVLAPQGLGLPLIEASDGRLRVAAIPFHRASPGLQTMFTAFLSEEATLRRAALAGFDYVAVCAMPVASPSPVAALYPALMAGKTWPGLEEVAVGSAAPLRLLRIDHARLR